MRIITVGSFSRLLLGPIILVLAIVILAISCQEEVILTQLDGVSEIIALDNGNNGDGSDIEVNFRKQPVSDAVGKYRVLILKNTAASSFTLDQALSATSNQYEEEITDEVFPLRGIQISSDMADTDGDLITSGVPYRVAVVSMPKDDLTHEPIMNISNDTYSLSLNNQVEDLSREMQSGAGSLAIDHDGNLIMAGYNIIDDLFGDTDEVSQMHMIRPDGQTIPFKGELPLLGGNHFDNHGNYYQSVLATGELIKIDPQGNTSQIEVEGKGLLRPDGVYADDLGDLFIIDAGSSKIIKIDQSGESSEFVDVGGRPRGITGDEEGNLYISMNNREGQILKITQEGQVSEFTTIPTFVPQDYTLEFIMWTGYITYFENHLYVAGTSTDRIYKIDLAGQVEVFAGSGTRLLPRGGASTAHFNRPMGLAFSSDGQFLYVSGCLDIAPQHTQATAPSLVYAIEIVE